MKKVLVYKGEWCGPCKVYSPKFEQVKKETPNVIFETIDVDSGDPRIIEHSIRNVPTTVVIEVDGSIRKQSGAMDVNQLKTFIG
jgi:thiol-disulfide isomerase/thioredoxin